MKLSIIIVTWNSEAQIEGNLRALLDSKKDFEFEIFVVDNNSEDKTVQVIKDHFPTVSLIENEANLGFAKANNQVIRQVDSDYVLLLNPDMIVKKDTLAKMIEWMDENQQASVAGCRLLDDQGETVKQVRKLPSLFDQAAIAMKLPHFFKNVLKKYIVEDFDYEKEQIVDSIRGAFFMINKKNIADLKMFQNRTMPELDERFFIWFEEVDFCRQVKQGGGEVWYTPTAECTDLIGKSFEKVALYQKQKYIRDSMLKYFEKWHHPGEALILRLAWALSGMLIQISKLLKTKPKAKT